MVGALVLVAGFALAVAEISDKEASATAPDDAVAEVRTKNLLASGAGAILVAVGEAAKALASALRGLTAPAMLVLMGGLMMIMSGVVAWQTIPGTDRNPTIEVSGESTTTTSTPAAAATTTTTRASTTSTSTAR